MSSNSHAKHDFSTSSKCSVCGMVRFNESVRNKPCPAFTVAGWVSDAGWGYMREKSAPFLDEEEVIRGGEPIYGVAAAGQQLWMARQEYLFAATRKGYDVNDMAQWVLTFTKLGLAAVQAEILVQQAELTRLRLLESD